MKLEWADANEAQLKIEAERQRKDTRRSRQESRMSKKELEKLALEMAEKERYAKEMADQERKALLGVEGKKKNRKNERKCDFF